MRDSHGLAGAQHYEFTSGVVSDEAKILKACEHTAKVIAGDDFALEVLSDYHQDAKAGRLNRDRLRGFIQGLYAAGAMSVEDYCDIDRLLDPA